MESQFKVNYRINAAGLKSDLDGTVCFNLIDIKGIDVWSGWSVVYFKIMSIHALLAFLYDCLFDIVFLKKKHVNLNEA